MGIPNYEAELNEMLEDGQEEEIFKIKQDPYFSIKDLGLAVWADRIIFESEVIKANKEKIAADNIAALQAKIETNKIWLEKSTKSENNTIEVFKAHLHNFHRNIIELEEEENKILKASGKKLKKISRTIKLPYRDLKSVSQQPEIIKDDIVLTNWVKDNDASTIPFRVIAEFIEKKDKEEIYEITVEELYEIVKQYDSKFISRDPKLAWGEYKKTLKTDIVDVTEVDEDGNEKVVGKRLAYIDECGQEIPCITLIEREAKFDWKQISSESEE